MTDMIFIMGKQAFSKITVFLLFSGCFLPVFGQSGLGESLDPIEWGTTFDLIYETLQNNSMFTEVEQDAANNVITAKGNFAGEPATITCRFENSELNEIAFEIETMGTGSEAYVGYENSYQTLQELYGSPTAINLFTGIRSWNFDDESSISLKTERLETTESRKTTGTLSGKGRINGESKTLGRDGGRTETTSTIDFDPAYNADGLVWDGEESYTLLKISTMITFTKPLVSEDTNEEELENSEETGSSEELEETASNSDTSIVED